jgi:hypothetical protein
MAKTIRRAKTNPQTRAGVAHRAESLARIERAEHKQEMRAATLQPFAVNLLKERI